MSRTFLLGVLFIASVGTALGQPYGERRPVRVEWDSRGWTMLGERTVNGRVDRDRIDVGRYEGRFNKLTFVVQDSDMELLDFSISFADRTKYEPRTGHYFREGQRTRVFDLPPGEQVIQHIDLHYRNIGGDGRAARVQVWGFKIASAPVLLPAPSWDNRGWELLGERSIDGRIDRDRINVGQNNAYYTALTLVALDSDFEMLDFRVKFGNNEVWSPGVNHYFRDNGRVHVIDLPGTRRFIKDIDFTYRNLPGDGRRARFQVWGRRAGPDAPPQFSWDSRGWVLLGDRTVNGRVDRDRIDVGRDEGKFSRLMIVVLDSDLELLEFNVRFNRGEEWHPNVRQVFEKNTRTRSIDLPGDRRTIKWIDVKYRNLAGDRRNARVQVYGR